MVELAADPHSDWPDRTPLYDEAGNLTLVFTASQDARDGREWADGVFRPPSTSVDHAADLALTAFPGWAFSTSDRELVDALFAAGAQRLRHAHAMSHDLRSLPASETSQPSQPRTSGLSIEPLTREELDQQAERLAQIRLAAYPAGHPDHVDDDVDRAVDGLRWAAAGEVLGPLMDVSRVARLGDQIVGVCIVVDRDGAPPEGGPWILDIFRDLTSPAMGVGQALLMAVLRAARAEALPGISLAVSHENARAIDLYSALGFTDASESWTLALPSSSR